MCGRYLLGKPDDTFAELGLIPDFPVLPRFNIAPTQEVPVWVGDHLERFRWGLVPAFASEDSPPHINARSESAHEKPSFRDAYAHRHCLVPASGFYEWKGRVPHLLYNPDGKALTFAGIWEERRSGGTSTKTFAILTTGASDSLMQIHHRQPVVIAAEDRKRWLNAAEDSKSLLEAGRDYGLHFRPLGPAVNSVANDTEACLEGPKQLSLF